MSLKAKIEAVIYASEEPVTLSQLAGLLGQEAQAELDHLHAAQQSLPLDIEASATSSLPEAEIEATSSEPAAAEPDESELKPKATPTEPAPTDSVPRSEPQPTDGSPIPEHPASADATAQAKPALTRPEEKNRERKLREYFRSILDQLMADYATSERGLEVREVAGGYRLATKPEYHDAVRGFVKSLKPPLKLSLQALETLAVVAYKQPVTGPEISEIRGVDSGGVLGSLMARKLIVPAGRKQVIGRPILYRTTKEFLLTFGLKDVSELPSIEEFEKMAGELADVEPIQEQIEMPDGDNQKNSARELEAELAYIVEPEENETEPQADGTSIPLEGSDESSAGVPAETAADEISTDGRISGLPPRYDSSLDQAPGEETPFDSPAMDAELQREQAEEATIGTPERL